MSIREDSFIAPISPETHDTDNLEWYEGAGYYVCRIDEEQNKTEWHGPYESIEQAFAKFGRVTVHGIEKMPDHSVL